MLNLCSYYNTFSPSMQAKVKRTNINKKDQARNMRGVRKYNDKINFIIAHGVKVEAVDNKKTLKGIKGDKEFQEMLNKKNNPEKYNEEGVLISAVNKFDESIFDEENLNNNSEANSEIITKEGEESVMVEKKKEDYRPLVDMSEYKDFKFDILFENERVIIINKWAGIMVHPDDRNVEATLSDVIYEKYPEIRLVGDYGRPGIVHRLDRNTTGALIICKNADSFKDMKNLFREHKVRKVYRAIVEGNIRDDMGIIDRPMARSRSDFRKKSIMDMYSKDFRGEERSAITKYKVLARSADKKFTYVEMYPLTGRTHQLRVHMSAIRHPIIGDDLYGSAKGASLAIRSMLHAYKIEFTLRKEEIKITSDLPQDFKKELEEKFNIC